jgi:arginyl-tRNA synthetase
MHNPLADAFSRCGQLIDNAYRAAVASGALSGGAPAGECSVPKEAEHGDVSSNFALGAAKALKKPPRVIADIMTEHLALPDGYFCKAETAGAGFINFFYSDEWRGSVLDAVEQHGGLYGHSNAGDGKSVIVEFVSANPTGPMTLGNARGGVLGDVLASLLNAAGYKAYREFYVNDTGNQVLLLTESLRARYTQRLRGEDACVFPENGYHGEYIWDLADKFIAEHGDGYLDADEADCLKAMREFALRRNVDGLKNDLLRYRIEYDCFFHESVLHDSGYVAETMELMKNNGFLYEKDGATWFKATDFNCEKDEVMIKSNGYYTYYAADIAYHRDKLEKRGFDIAVDVLGADHHGHILRFRAGLQAIGIDPERLQPMLYQLVNLVYEGKPMRMSKRTGRAITLSELLDEVSVDAARFFFNNRSTDTHLEFDMALAVREDSDNPVYYVQYAHARICSVLRKLANENITTLKASCIDASALGHETELALLKTLALFPEEIAVAARQKQPYKVNRYLIELAASFHRFYNSCRIKEAEPPVRDARLKLADSVRIVLRNGLTLLSVDAPEEM